MLYFARGNENAFLSHHDLQEGLITALEALGPRRKVLAIPPDITRFFSRAGELTRYAADYYGKKLTDILPALGTHAPMTEEEIRRMYADVPLELFRQHNWRKDLKTLGRVPAEYIREISEGRVDYDWPAQVNQLLTDGGFDLILSIGQVVPHEVIGMANYNKNIFVGTGGAEGINKSHFLGAAYGMERIMGRADTPVRRVLNYASEHFAGNLPIVYVLTVVSAVDNRQAVRGLFIGDDIECFNLAAALSLKVNFKMLDKPLKKAVVYLDPHEFKSTWLGNKSIYRTRMAMADGGKLIVLAPGLKEFGEDKEIDRLIRQYGYVGTDRVLQLVEANADLQNNLSAAAHLIHGSSEGRFDVIYCPGHITKEEIESAGFSYAELDAMMHKYNPCLLKDGFNEVDGEEIFYISNPGLGLWAYRERFK
ncbi:MAG TPA: lactate racemase domain-containing protein [Anaerohalosphaeraceae bacterium]|nr:lactate racemase domain-containing protein [Anaerohalosphaeraceae bacterium]HOL31759.1 lactate racemase domain-containing protein [Anaerohalosphaeraceae bacterium]HOM75002.1 lactate racemase domain-containing protein [Anaerohalosphaeraceae bacterium]HPC63253.1 lactate racemase domain-containing protein [Anaerohalosphaeraceae bacterium]HPO69555.1 lactate racemase domain-containing protein [Anaerohalosphaeraceae bacterium]